MPDIACLCGTIRLRVAKRPDHINECNCTLCRKTGARWGYFHPSEVAVSGATASYTRDDKDEPAARICFCATCGVTTHFVLTESIVEKLGDGMMGVNMWLADEADLAGIELRYPDGRAWSGDGDFGYVRAATIIGG